MRRVAGVSNTTPPGNAWGHGRRRALRQFFNASAGRAPPDAGRIRRSRRLRRAAFRVFARFALPLASAGCAIVCALSTSRVADPASGGWVGKRRGLTVGNPTLVLRRVLALAAVGRLKTKACGSRGNRDMVGTLSLQSPLRATAFSPASAGCIQSSNARRHPRLYEPPSTTRVRRA
jgi:hypothetical protein